MLQHYLYSDFLPGKIAAWLIVFMALNVLVLLLILTVKRIATNREENLEESLNDKYETFITNILFEENYAPGTAGYKAVVKSVLKQRRDTTHHKVLSQLFFQYTSNFQGEMLLNLKRFYNDCGQKKYALRMLKYGEWHEKASIIRELGRMDVKEALPSIKKHVDSRNDIMRMQAQFALIDLEGAEGIEFLRTTQKPLSEWQQLRLIEEIENLAFIEIPDFYKLLESKNQSVVIFGLKLIRQFEQTEKQEHLLPFVQHENAAIQTEVLHTFQLFGMLQGLNLFIESFEALDEKIQNQCIAVCGDIGDESHKHFLRSCLNWDNYDKRMLALEALLKLGLKVKTKEENTEALNPYLQHLNKVKHYDLG